MSQLNQDFHRRSQSSSLLEDANSLLEDTGFGSKRKANDFLHRIRSAQSQVTIEPEIISQKELTRFNLLDGRSEIYIYHIHINIYNVISLLCFPQMSQSRSARFVMTAHVVSEVGCVFNPGLSQLNQDFIPQVLFGSVFNPGLSQLNQDFIPQVLFGSVFNPGLSQLNQDFFIPQVDHTPLWDWYHFWSLQWLIPERKRALKPRY